MQHSNAALKLCSVYFFTVFSAAILINLAFIKPSLQGATSEEELPNLIAYLEELEQQENDYLVSQINIESKDLTGIKRLVLDRRNRLKAESKKAEEQNNFAQFAAQTESQTKKSKNKKSSTRVMASYVADTDHEFGDDDYHPAAGKYSKNFVPFDKSLKADAVKYTEENYQYTEADIRNTIVKAAKKHLGTRYVWGGKKPGGFDCSGFTAYLMKLYGIIVSPSSRHQGLQGASVALSATKPGDLVFFSRYGKGGRITHVAMVVENAGNELYVIHACSKGIRIDEILHHKYWKPKILYAKNVINPKNTRPTESVEPQIAQNEVKAIEQTPTAIPVATTTPVVETMPESLH